MIRDVIDKVLKSNQPTNTSLLAIFLHGLSLLYAAGVKTRLAGYRHRVLPMHTLPCKVISIGNITVGGTGKTPLTLYVTELIRRWGLRVAVISRGYKGGAEHSGGIVGDGRRLLLSPQAAGDEPFLMAALLTNRSVPVLVGQDRLRIGLRAIQQFKPDILVLDDGFQHIRLARDVNIVLLDSRQPFGNGHLLPRGILREPLSSLHRADLFVLTRSDPPEKAAATEDPDGIRSDLPDRPVFQAAHMPLLRTWIEADQNIDVGRLTQASPADNRLFAGRRVFAFSGIAANDAFRQSLTGLGAEISGFMEYRDHHFYTPQDADRIVDSARSAGADCLCTTDKDAVKLSLLPAWPLDLAVMGVDIDFGSDSSAFAEALRSQLAMAG